MALRMSAGEPQRSGPGLSMESVSQDQVAPVPCSATQRSPTPYPQTRFAALTQSFVSWQLLQRNFVLLCL
jgi:hypothetical protein